MIDRPGQTGFDIAEGTGAGAGIAEHHKGGVFLLPALADIGTARLLADRDERALSDDLLGLGEHFADWRANTDPVRLAQHRRIGALLLLWMPRSACFRSGGGGGGCSAGRSGSVDQIGHVRHVSRSAGGIKLALRFEGAVPSSPGVGKKAWLPDQPSPLSCESVEPAITTPSRIRIKIAICASSSIA